VQELAQNKPEEPPKVMVTVPAQTPGMCCACARSLLHAQRLQAYRFLLRVVKAKLQNIWYWMPLR
jgi:hypothetical protein